MTRRKSVCSKWTLVLLVVVFCPSVYPRPQETSPASSISSSTSSVQTDKATETPLRNSSKDQQEAVKTSENSVSPAPATSDSPRNVKTKGPVIGESIKMVASQLLETPSNATSETPIVIDTRIPPKVKNQLAHKHKIKTRQEDREAVENSHAGIAVPVTMEELETENKISESSTSNEGISTWVLLSNPAIKENITSTEATKSEELPKKQKPNATKNKTKRPSNNKVPAPKRPIIGSTNKSDLVAGGSAINENVYNKIKDTVLSNVQKNKNSPQRTTTSTTTTTVSPSTESSTTKSTKKEVITKAPTTETPVVKATSKPTRKKNKNKHKTSSTTLAPIISESALLPMEPKEQEIELEISTPPTTTKKPKRSSTKKKTKTKKRKTSKPKPESTTTVSQVKTSNKTKSTKTKKPVTSLTGPITSQLYNYFSREVMPTVGVGVLGLASLVGLAGYFFYPFSTPVRRTFEVDKKDDIYRHNAEEYANEGNGQAEEEMLGTVLAGMPAHAKHKLNPYAGQTTHVNRYPVKKEQDLRYRHVTANYEPNYNAHYPQQKTGIAHGAVYSEPVNYNPQYETRHVYTTEGKYVYDKGLSSYTPHQAVEPIYAAPQTDPQTGPSGPSSYGNDASNSVVYGVKPSSDSDFKPVYPFENQFFSETTSNPMTYPPTSMYLGSNSEEQEEQKYAENTDENGDDVDNKFVVGNVPKELVDSATPAVVPEHGPRNLNRKKRNINRRKRSIVGSIEDILKAAKENKKDIFISNEIDGSLGVPTVNPASIKESAPVKLQVTTTPLSKDVYTVYAMAVDSKEEKATTTDNPITTLKTEVIESVSTIPIDNNKPEKTTTESDLANELEVTTKTFRVYEVFSTSNPSDTSQGSATKENPKAETTTQFKNLNTETTTDLKSETTSTMPPSPSPFSDKDSTTTVSNSQYPNPTNNPEVLTYPPLNQGGGGFFTFLKRLIEFKYRLGLSILQTTSENLNRYLRSMENSVQKMAKASKS